MLNWHGQVVVVRHSHSPRYWDRAAWGMSTVRLTRDSSPVTSPGRPSLNALVSFTVYDPAATWRPRPNFPAAAMLPDQVWSHRYLLVPVAHGCRWRDRAGFGVTLLDLPPADLPPTARRTRIPLFQAVTLPHWSLAVLTGAWPASYLSYLWRRRRQRGRRPGACADCGYDLRATPEAGGALLDQCPECGAASATRAGPLRSRAQPVPSSPSASHPSASGEEKSFTPEQNDHATFPLPVPRERVG